MVEIAKSELTQRIKKNFIRIRKHLGSESWIVQRIIKKDCESWWSSTLPKFKIIFRTGKIFIKITESKGNKEWCLNGLLGASVYDLMCRMTCLGLIYSIKLEAIMHTCNFCPLSVSLAIISQSSQLSLSNLNHWVL